MSEAIKEAMSDIPKEMKRLVVTSPGAGDSVADCTVEVETVPTPVPKAGEVLVKMAAAPVNPSDYGSWTKSKSSSYPMAIGKEGCGVVAATGGGLATYRCPVGTKVGVTGVGGQGSYAEYVTVNAVTGAFPMPEEGEWATRPSAARPSAARFEERTASGSRAGHFVFRQCDTIWVAVATAEDGSGWRGGRRNKAHTCMEA